MQNVMHIAPNGHTAKNDGWTMQNDGHTMRNVGRNTLHVFQGPKGGLEELFLYRLACQFEDIKKWKNGFLMAGQLF